MICKIADLGVSVPDLGDLPERCRPYEADVPVDVTLDGALLSTDRYPTLTPAENLYLESGFLFYRYLVNYGGLMIHASAVALDGVAYLFSGPSGMGKSTHTAMYIKNFPGSTVLNDDKPALRLIDGQWMVYGTPWCGKDGINANASAKLGGICFLQRGDTRITRLPVREAARKLMRQTLWWSSGRVIEKMMPFIDSLVGTVPVFEFFNHALEGDAYVTYQAMNATAFQEKTT